MRPSNNVVQHMVVSKPGHSSGSIAGQQRAEKNETIGEGKGREESSDVAGGKIEEGEYLRRAEEGKGREGRWWGKRLYDFVKLWGSKCKLHILIVFGKILEFSK